MLVFCAPAPARNGLAAATNLPQRPLCRCFRIVQIKPVPEEYLECDGPLSSHDYKVTQRRRSVTAYL